MSRLTNKGQGATLSLFQVSTDSSLTTQCGQRFDLEDGREVVLVLNNASTAATPGTLQQASAIVANHQDLAVTAFSAATVNSPATVTATLGGTAATANQYAGGYLTVSNSTGIGQTLKIASHPAQANTTGSLVITLEDSPVTALTTSSKVSLLANLYVNTVINPTTATNTPVGVALYPIAVSSYGYLITKGPTSLLAQGAIGVGLGVAPSTTTAGAGVVMAATLAQIGRALQAGVTTESRVVYVDL